jgi:hypothetical protein
MRLINSIYVLTEDGDPLFIRECYPQGLGNADHALFSDFLTAFHHLAIDLGATRIKTIGLTKSVIFSRYDDDFKIRFILKCEKQANPSKMNNFLDQIKVYFLSTFKECSYDISRLKSDYLHYFAEYVNELLIIGKNLGSFMDTL